MTILLLWALLQAEEPGPVWLTHPVSDASRIAVSWWDVEGGEPVVEYGPTPELGTSVRGEAAGGLRHVDLPMPPPGGRWHYRVGSGGRRSAVAVLRGYPEGEMRVAVVANWHARPDLPGLMKDDVHLLLTAGDNVPKLWPHEDARTNVGPYLDLIRRYRGLFAATPFMPVPGNHDKEMRPREAKPPAEPVYDVEATAFRRVFALPGDETRWVLDLPGFDVRLVALDLHHTSDAGTTWQSCAPFGPESAQLREYREVLAGPRRVLTLFNERHATVRGLAGGAWGEAVGRSALAVSGFGYFAERAEPGGAPRINTSLGGRGAKYADPAGRFFASEDNYLLLTIRRGTAVAELKALDGRVLDRSAW